MWPNPTLSFQNRKHIFLLETGHKFGFSFLNEKGGQTASVSWDGLFFPHLLPSKGFMAPSTLVALLASHHRHLCQHQWLIIQAIENWLEFAKLGFKHGSKIYARPNKALPFIFHSWLFSRFWPKRKIALTIFLFFLTLPGAWYEWCLFIKLVPGVKEMRFLLLFHNTATCPYISLLDIIITSCRS